MHIKTLASLLLGSTLLLPGFTAEQKPARKPVEDQTIRLEVEMVSLPVVVTDRGGKRITDLKQDDFQIFENGVKQEIAGFTATDEPVDVALLLDTSGSTELELARIQNAAIDFVNELHPDDEVAILSFADDVKLQEGFSIDRDKNEYGIKKTRSGGCTVAYEAVWLALQEVLRPIKERKALVLFSDGVDTCSTKASDRETLELAKETQATIYCVYYDTEADQYRRRPTSTLGGRYPSVILSPLPPVISPTVSGTTDHETYSAGRTYLNWLAEYSGGLVFDGMQDLSSAFAQVAKELASQYSIGYYSTDRRHDGKFRKVEVKINKPGLIARTKKGYYTKKDKTK